MFNIITLPENFITGASSSIFAYTGQLFSDFSTLVGAIVGILLGLVVLEIIVGIFRK
jgi:hypothetical protein